MLARFTFENIIYGLGVVTFSLLVTTLLIGIIYILFYMAGYSSTKTTKILSLQNIE